MARTPTKYVARDGRVTYRVRFRSPDGHETTETFATPQAARVFCSDLEHHGPGIALSMLDAAAEVEDSPPLDKVADAYLAWKDGRVRSTRTTGDYRRDYRNWIAPTLGARPIVSIVERDVQTWVDAMHAGTLGRAKASPKSIADRHALLHAICDYACHPSRAILTHNPCLVTDLPKRPLRQPKGLRPAEWQAIHAALTQINADAADLAAFLLGSGWRWSEAVALTTYGVEISADASVHVVMSQVARRGADHKVSIVPDAKSQGSLRRTETTPPTFIGGGCFCVYRDSIARTVEAYHSRPPCAVGTRA